MAKLTREQRIEIYHKRKSGVTIPSLSKQYGINKKKIMYIYGFADFSECPLFFYEEHIFSCTLHLSKDATFQQSLLCHNLKTGAVQFLMFYCRNCSKQR